MTTPTQPAPGAEPAGSRPSPGVGSRLLKPAPVLIVSSVMFTFISYWRTAAVVLCDLASTAYYIGGIVESSIGKAAPWFILAVMLFSYAVRSVYIESCSLFVRGGVYRVVKEAHGRLPRQAVGVGPDVRLHPDRPDQRRLGRAVHHGPLLSDPGTSAFGRLEISARRRHVADELGAASVVIACGVTLYFFRQNLLGIHESSDKALKIMIATTVMAVVILVWCGVTLFVKGPGQLAASACWPRPES